MRFRSPAHSFPQQSSSSWDLLPEMMESETPPQASSANWADDVEVSSRRVSPDRGIIEPAPQGETSVTQSLKCAVPTRVNNKVSGLSGLQPKMTLGSSEHIPSKGVRTPAAASRSPEAPDTLMGMLQDASISEEHRTLMAMVVERILSARSGLNEAFTSLLRGFEVCTVIFPIVFYSQNTPMYR